MEARGKAMNANIKAKPPGSRDDGKGWLAGIGIIVAILFAVSKCSDAGDQSKAAEAAASPSVDTLKTAVAAQAPPPIQPLSPAGVSQGVRDMRAALTAEGVSGAMVYSQNCYDALAKGFGWRTLDACGAADMKAVAAVPEDGTTGLEKESAYFQSEIAAARYLGAATAAGASPEAADERLAALQGRIPAARPPASAETVRVEGVDGITAAAGAPDDAVGLSGNDETAVAN